MALTQCRGPIHNLTASSGMVGSSGFRRIHSLRTLTARADFPAAISDRASWYHRWNSSKANFMALSKHWRSEKHDTFHHCYQLLAPCSCLLSFQSKLDCNLNLLECAKEWRWYFMWMYHGCGFWTSFYNHYVWWPCSPHRDYSPLTASHTALSCPEL